MPEQLIPASAPLPPIRTMADDLASVARGEPVPVDLSGSSWTSATTRGASLAPLPIGRAGRRRVVLILCALLAAGVATAGVWGTVRFLPRKSGTIADVLPTEALAFVSVRSGAGTPDDPGARQLAEQVRSTIAVAIGIQPEDLAATSEVAYVLLRGSAPAEPLTSLFVRGVKTVDLSAAPEFGFQRFRDGVFITKSTDLGRLGGLSGRTWTAEKELVQLFRSLPKDPPVLAAFRADGLATVLQPFVPSVNIAHPLVLAVSSGGQGSARVAGRSTGSWKPADRQKPLPSTLAARLPAESVLVLQREGGALLGAFLGSGPTAARTSVSLVGMDAFRRSLSPHADVVGNLLRALSGPGIMGVLPTVTPGVRDVAAVLPLQPGADPLPFLRALELSFRDLGPPLAGAPFFDAAFTETDYAGVHIRYINFGSPARAFDYAVNDGHLLLATSRESMYALIQTIQGSHPSLSGHPAFSAVLGSVGGTEWVFFRTDPAVIAEVPAPYARLTDLLAGLLLQPTAAGELEGALVLSSTAFSAATISAPDSSIPAAAAGLVVPPAANSSSAVAP